MKVKNHCPEYASWKTERQWAEKHFVIVDKSKAVELWSNQFCNVSSLYASEDNVRPMNEEELQKFKSKKTKERKEAEERRKEKKADYERRCKYADELRENWHTEWQWLRDYRRIVNDGATWKDGESLNERIDWNLFGSDYCYFNIKDTTLIKDDEEYKRLVDESNKRYLKNININEE